MVEAARGARLSRTVSRIRQPIPFLNAVVVWAKWELDGLSGSCTRLYSSRVSLLDSALLLAPPDGLHLEFGVYQGESINHLAQIYRGQWYGFDSFQGLPLDWTPWHREGTFHTHGMSPQVEANVTLVKGWFSETLPKFLASRDDFRVSFLHIDSDLYESANLVLSTLSDGIRAGTVIVFDEYTGIMPDDEARAFRAWYRRTGHTFSFIGCSPSGSVAVRITS